MDFNPDSIETDIQQERKDWLRSTIIEKLEEIDDNPETVSDVFAGYFADEYTGHTTNFAEKRREIIYSNELVLAIQNP